MKRASVLCVLAFIVLQACGRGGYEVPGANSTFTITSDGYPCLFTGAEAPLYYSPYLSSKRTGKLVRYERGIMKPVTLKNVNDPDADSWCLFVSDLSGGGKGYMKRSLLAVKESGTTATQLVMTKKVSADRLGRDGAPERVFIESGTLLSIDGTFSGEGRVYLLHRDGEKESLVFIPSGDDHVLLAAKDGLKAQVIARVPVVMASGAGKPVVAAGATYPFLGAHQFDFVAYGALLEEKGSVIWVKGSDILVMPHALRAGHVGYIPVLEYAGSLFRMQYQLSLVHDGHILPLEKREEPLNFTVRTVVDNQDESVIGIETVIDEDKIGNDEEVVYFRVRPTGEHLPVLSHVRKWGMAIDEMHGSVISRMKVTSDSPAKGILRLKVSGKSETEMKSRDTGAGTSESREIACTLDLKWDAPAGRFVPAADTVKVTRKTVKNGSMIENRTGDEPVASCKILFGREVYTDRRGM